MMNGGRSVLSPIFCAVRRLQLLNFRRTMHGGRGAEWTKNGEYPCPADINDQNYDTQERSPAVRYAAILMLTVFLAACSSGDKANKTDNMANQAKSGSAATADVDLNGTPVILAGMTFVPPTSWKDMGPSGMRKGEYAFGPVDGEGDSATVTIFYFGSNQGGSVESNINRWVGQVTPPEGASEPLREDIQVDSMPVHLVKTTGTYNASMGGPMSGNTVQKPDYTLVGIVVEAPEGSVFFKLTGPEKTANAMNDMFQVAIQNIKKS